MKTAEAIRRVNLILPLLIDDVRTAVRSHAIMEANNAIVPKGMVGFHSEFVESYNGVQNALALKLALDLARIFDLSDITKYPAHKQDKASVQVLAALFSLQEVRSHFGATAGAQWFPGIAHLGTVGVAPEGLVEATLKNLEDEHRLQNQTDCLAAIDNFIKLAAQLTLNGSEENEALGRVREFRNRRLAHSLFDKTLQDIPRFSDLHLLLAVAMQSTKLASLAVNGTHRDFDELAKIYRINADGFASLVLEGLKR